MILSSLTGIDLGGSAINTIWIAIIVAVGSLTSPLILAYVTGRQRRTEKLKDDQQRRKEKLEDYERQDAVAALAAEAARLLVQRQDETAREAAEAARLLLAANERVAQQSAEASTATQGQLRQIHTLVNSNLTDAQRKELEATKTMLVTMEEVVSLKRDRGVEPSVRTIKEIAAAQVRIEALERDLAHKDQQTVVAEKQLEQGSGQ